MSDNPAAAFKEWRRRVTFNGQWCDELAIKAVTFVAQRPVVMWRKNVDQAATVHLLAEYDEMDAPSDGSCVQRWYDTSESLARRSWRLRFQKTEKCEHAKRKKKKNTLKKDTQEWQVEAGKISSHSRRPDHAFAQGGVKHIQQLHDRACVGIWQHCEAELQRWRVLEPKLSKSPSRHRMPEQRSHGFALITRSTVVFCGSIPKRCGAQPQTALRCSP